MNSLGLSGGEFTDKTVIRRLNYLTEETIKLTFQINQTYKIPDHLTIKRKVLTES